MTSFEEFKKLSSGGNVIPIFETVLADTETPVSVYLKIQGESAYSFLLESVEGGEKLGRYSFIGFNPFMNVTIREKRFSIETFHDDVKILPSLVDPDDHPLEALKKLFAHIKTVKVPGLPRFSCGAVGYFGYETVRLVEDIPVPAKDELEIPDSILMFFDVVLVFDNVKHELFLISNAYLSKPNLTDAELKKEYDKAAGEIEKLKSLLQNDMPTALANAESNGKLEYIVSKENFCKSVERSKQYIVEGDIFQVVLSQRLKQKARVRPIDVYRSLRLINPSPYMYFLSLKDFFVIGSSPEMLVRVENGIVETRPIAGTRRRGNSTEEDERLVQELLDDEKEKAEHLMLVDLGRNDLGRISEYATVEVKQFMATEKYSHVIHIVSSVQGKLRDGLTPLDALFSCFPAGTLTGAPKIRAMQIISELEPVKRGVYGGAIAYLDFSGNMDSCIAIRTIVAKEDTLFFQAGAGIVYDSKPEREFEETIEKLGANLQAVERLKEIVRQ
ncbi:MAG: anthranilate synthase component I [Ignavibacteriae bacterium]|nr:anthranilate synthase component I [Ignavibacteriota bacterium]